MLYRVVTNKELFLEWQAYEKETGMILLSSLVQNDMFLTTQELNEAFDDLHNRLKTLSDKYAPAYLQGITALRDKTVTYVNNLNRVPLTEVEFREFSLQCQHHTSQFEGFAAQQEAQHTDGSKPSAHNCSHSENQHKGFDNCAQRNCPLVRAGIYA